jgi:hypothetical protein
MRLQPDLSNGDKWCHGLRIESKFLIGHILRARGRDTYHVHGACERRDHAGTQTHSEPWCVDDPTPKKCRCVQEGRRASLLG